MTWVTVCVAHGYNADAHGAVGDESGAIAYRFARWQFAHADDLGFHCHDRLQTLNVSFAICTINGTVMSVIDLESRAVLSIDYPWSVHDARQRKRKIGL